MERTDGRKYRKIERWEQDGRFRGTAGSLLLLKQKFKAQLD